MEFNYFCNALTNDQRIEMETKEKVSVLFFTYQYMHTHNVPVTGVAKRRQKVLAENKIGLD